MCVIGVTLPYGSGGHQTPSSPRCRCGGGVWRVWHSSTALITAPPLVDEAPPTEVGAVAGGGCAARELVGGSQPYGIFFHLGLPSAAELLLRRACPGPREDIAPHLCWSGRNGDSVTRSRPTCSKSGANNIWVLPIHMDICFPCGCAPTRARLVPLEPVRLR